MCTSKSCGASTGRPACCLTYGKIRKAVGSCSKVCASWRNPRLNIPLSLPKILHKHCKQPHPCCNSARRNTLSFMVTWLPNNSTCPGLKENSPRGTGSEVGKRAMSENVTADASYLGQAVAGAWIGGLVVFLRNWPGTLVNCKVERAGRLSLVNDMCLKVESHTGTGQDSQPYCTCTGARMEVKSKPVKNKLLKRCSWLQTPKPGNLPDIDWETWCIRLEASSSSLPTGTWRRMARERRRACYSCVLYRKCKEDVKDRS